MIKKGTTSIGKVCKGTTEIANIYKGTTLLYENWKTLTSQGVPPLTLSNCENINMLDYKVYGNSVQDGTPSLSNPVEIESVGDKTKNMLDVPQSYTFTGYPNLISKVDQFELNVQYKLVWTKTIKGSTNLPAINLGGNVGWVYNMASGGGSKTFTYTTLPSNIYIYANGANASQSSGVTSTVEGLMIIKATEDTTYEPYGYKIPIKVNNDTTNIYLKEPLRKIGDYADYIDFANQKVVRNVREYTITGSSSEAWFDRYAPTIISNIFISQQQYKIKTSQRMYNTIALNSGTYGFRTTNTTGYAVGFDNAYEYFGVSSLSEFTAKLAQIKPKFIYVLDTPIEETIQLSDILLNSGQNIIDIDTDITPSNLYVQYKGKIA